MNHYICNTCGVQYPNSAHAPETCLICADERQYIHPDGQSWITLQQLVDSREYKNTIVQEEEGLYSLTTTPSFAIGQTACLVRNEGFNLLWDCITYLDEKTENELHSLGGIDESHYPIRIIIRHRLNGLNDSEQAFISTKLIASGSLGRVTGSYSGLVILWSLMWV